MNHEIENGLPRGVALSWGLVNPPQRGPKREMSVERIVEAAIAIADEEGLTAVSMNRVAATLGFTAMSLYRYVPSKEDLLLLMQDAACDIPTPPLKDLEDWRENMREYVRACTKVFVDHPWYGDIPISGVPIMPNTLQCVDFGLRTMRKLPLSDFEKMSILLLLSGYARSVGMVERDEAKAIQAGASPSAFSGFDYSSALKQLITPERFPDLHKAVTSGAYTHENEAENPIDNDFDFGLERILDGIEQYLCGKQSQESDVP